MKIQTKIQSLILGLGLSLLAQAEEGTAHLMFSEKPTIKITDEVLPANIDLSRVFADAPAEGEIGLGGIIDEVDVILDKIINVGKKAWKVVEDGRPVVNLKIDSASALPEGVTAWNQLSGWQTPVSKRYDISYKNLYGFEVINFNFRVIYTYGGNVNGKGQYLSRIAVSPANVDVAWGYRFDANVSVPNVVNTGSTVDPVAAAEVNVEWIVSTVMKYSKQTENFFVKGNGEMVHFE